MRIRILILALGTFAIGTDGFVIAGILPEIARSFNIPVSTAGILITVFAWAYALGSPVLATATGKLARKRLLLVSMVVFVAANVLASFATNFGILVGARILAAFGSALYTPAALAVAVSLSPAEKRGRALALVLAGLTVATVLGVPLGILIGTQLNWQTTFLVVAGHFFAWQVNPYGTTRPHTFGGSSDARSCSYRLFFRQQAEHRNKKILFSLERLFSWKIAPPLST